MEIYPVPGTPEVPRLALSTYSLRMNAPYIFTNRTLVGILFRLKIIDFMLQIAHSFSRLRRDFADITTKSGPRTKEHRVRVLHLCIPLGLERFLSAWEAISRSTTT